MLPNRHNLLNRHLLPPALPVLQQAIDKHPCKSIRPQLECDLGSVQIAFIEAGCHLTDVMAGCASEI